MAMTGSADRDAKLSRAASAEGKRHSSGKLSARP
jgi:hypothetical protein